MVCTRWSVIAGRLPGRTANDIKNYWNCHLSKKLNGQLGGVEDQKANPTKEEAFFGKPQNWEHPQEESSKSRAKGKTCAADHDQNINGENSQEMILVQNQNQNLPIIVEQQSNSMGSLGNLQMEFKALEDDHHQQGCNKREVWDDWISEMDLWIDSL